MIVKRFSWILQNPTTAPIAGTLKEQNNLFALRARCLANFELQENTIYRKAEDRFQVRYAPLDDEVFHIVANVHCQLAHTGIKKTFAKAQEMYYGISEIQVTWIVQH